MAKKKCYAVRIGKQTGLFYSWPECEAAVKGYPGAQYKGFTSEEDAKMFLNGKDNCEKIQFIEPELKKNEAIAYVDGSYNDELEKYGSGVLFISKDGEIEISKEGCSVNMVEMQNVGGEIIASMLAIDYAIEHGYEKLYIVHDYTGIAGWANGWKTNEKGSEEYKKFIEDRKNKIELEFFKIKAHSGNKKNNRADTLAKEACGIK